jgi:uncharacterized integral membrane protein
MSDTPDATQVEYRGTGFYVSLAVTALIVIALLILALQNTEAVTFEFLKWDIELPLFGLIIITAFLAIALDEVFGLVWRRRRRRQLSERQELARLREVSGTKAPVEITPPKGDTGLSSEPSAE